MHVRRLAVFAMAVLVTGCRTRPASTRDAATEAGADAPLVGDVASADDAVAEEPGRVMCGSTACASGMVCGAARSGFHTYTVAEFACVAADADGGNEGLAVAACDGPEDCPADTVCCAGDRGGTECRASCTTGTLCHSNLDCAGDERNTCKAVPDRFADAGASPPCTSFFTEALPLNCAVPTGTRVCGCPDGGLFCEGACRTASDPNHCGACGRGCLSGGCCHGTCFDPGTDLNNCGACGHQCPGGVPCVGGACGTCACTDGTACCGGTTCVDLKSDPRHCGLCGTDCGPGGACAGGVCVARCASPTQRCDEACRAILEDPMSCGHCFVRCAPGAACSDGRCAAALGCSAPELVSVATDAGQAVAVEVTAPFTSGTAGGPVSPSASVVVSFRVTPPSQDTYELPSVYWRSSPLSPWTAAGIAGTPSAGFSATIPALAAPGQIDFYIVARCASDGRDDRALPSVPGTSFSYQVH